MNSDVFNPLDSCCKFPLGGVPAGMPAVFSLRTGRGFSVSAARMRIRADAGPQQIVVMEHTGIQDLKDVFRCEFTPLKAGLFWYDFELDTPGGIMFICHSSDCKVEIKGNSDQEWQLTVYEQGYSTPEWIKGGLIYQIFPDRFYREGGFPKDMPPERVLREDWGGMPEYRPDGNGKILNNDYFGGNLKGIISKLPYIKGLGATAIYLNPIFEAHSNHRYNTADYKKIDPMLGNEDDFRLLCSEAQKQGIRIILDGVFNHTGDDSVYFNKYGRYPEIGAYQSQESNFSGWYDFTNWPDKYRCWWDFTTLPSVNENDPTFFEYITGTDGVLEHWLDAGASGWRLDVADELPAVFLEKIRYTIKQKKPESLLVGEVWEDASNKISYGERRHYLEGKELDSVINYPFKNAIIDFILCKDAERLNATVMSIIEHYPKQSLDSMMNVLGTHDTMRIITELAGQNADGNNRAWKAAQFLNDEETGIGSGLVQVASAIQFFLPGVPCIYYGDEAGLQGYDDPFNRRCFPWGYENAILLEWYRKLGHIRAACPALAEGRYELLKASDGLFAFIRSDNDSALLCAANVGNKPAAVELPSGSNFVQLAASTDKMAGDAVISAGECAIFGAGVWTDGLMSRTDGI